MAVCGLPLHLGSLESRKTLEQKFIFQIGILNPHGINECSSFTYFIFRETCFSSCHERGTKKKILSSHEESSLRPSDFVLGCPTTEPR